MPGYIGYRPQFNPISLQDYLAVPTMIMGEYAKAEDAYNETATKAEALKALLGERNADNEAGWRIVDNYERQLGDLTNQIAKGIQGPEAYRQAKGAQRYYRENMLPLESGIPAYQEELKKYNSDPTMIGTRPTLESYIKNPLYRAQMMSGSVIQNEATKAAASASARRKQETADELIRGGQYYSYRELTGFSPEEVAAWLQDHNNSPELSAIYNQIKDKYEQSGYTEDQFKQYIERGIIDGITYDNKRHDAENKAYETPAQRAARIAAETPQEPSFIPLASRDLYDIKNDDRIKKYKRMGIITEDANGNLHVDKKKIETYLNMSDKDIKQEIANIDSQINILDNALNHQAKGGQRNPNHFMNITYEEAMRKYPEAGIRLDKRNNPELSLDSENQKRLKLYFKEQLKYKKQLKEDLKGGQVAGRFINDIKDLGDFQIAIQKDDKGNKYVDVTGLDNILNNSLGDTYSLNKEYIYNIDSTNQADAKDIIRGYIRDFNALAGFEIVDGKKKSHKITDSEWENSIPKRIITSKNRAYVELMSKSGNIYQVTLPQELASDLQSRDTAIRNNNRNYQQFVAIYHQGALNRNYIKKWFPGLKEEYVDILLNNPQAISDLFDRNLSIANNNWNQQVADMIRTKKSPEIKIEG